MGNCSSCTSSSLPTRSLEIPENPPPERVELKALIDRLENENPFDYPHGIQPLVNKYDTLQNQNLLRNFTLSKVEEILENTNVAANKKDLVRSALYEIYQLSFREDSKVAELVDYFSDFLTNLSTRRSQDQSNIFENKRLRQMFEDLKTLELKSRIDGLQKLSENDAFIRPTHFQELLDDVIKGRTLDFLKTCPTPPNKTEMESIQLVINNIIDLLNLRNQIGRAIIQCSNEIACMHNIASSISDTNPTKIERSKSHIRSLYANEVYEAVYKLTLQLVVSSYESNDKLQKELKEIGKKEHVRVSNFLSHENFSVFLDKYFSNRFNNIDNLVKYFLNGLDESRLNTTLQSLKKLPPNDKVGKTAILLSAFEGLGLTLEDLDAE